MPTPVATQVKCPECGARLSVADDAVSATCTYCQTTSRIQRRTQFLQMRVPLPPAQHHEPKRVARQVRSGRGKLALAAVLLIGIGVPVAIIGSLVLSHFGVIGGPNWDGVIAVADVDGDGTLDVIGFDRNVHRDQLRLAAFSGKDGHALWETASLGGYRDVGSDILGVAGDAVLLADKLAHLEAYDLKSGARRWRISAPEIIDAVCDGTPPLVATADRKVSAVALATGVLSPSTASCKSLASWNPVGAVAIHDHLPTIDGMTVDRLFARGDGLRIAIGQRHPGSAVPMVAGIDASGAAVWHTEIPGHEPLGAVGHAIDHLAISDREVAIAYARDNRTPPEIAVFDRATGARRFEVRLAKGFMNVISSIVLTPSGVAVSSGGNLQMLDLATGKQLFMIGS